MSRMMQTQESAGEKIKNVPVVFSEDEEEAGEWLGDEDSFSDVEPLCLHDEGRKKYYAQLKNALEENADGFISAAQWQCLQELEWELCDECKSQVKVEIAKSM